MIGGSRKKGMAEKRGAKIFHSFTSIWNGGMQNLSVCKQK
jgi:hypothetical protein